MNIKGKAWRTIWLDDKDESVGVIDQTKLPHSFSTCSLRSYQDAAAAIQKMIVRGAPLIGVTGAYGLMLALKQDASDKSLQMAFDCLDSTRPTAVNLRWALQRVFDRVKSLSPSDRADAAKQEAGLIAQEDIAMCEAIGENGLSLIQKLVERRSPQKRSAPLNILTHCNAGWLATVDWGTALSPIYKAHRAGLNIHVWVDETRPRNQGASLTAFELESEGVPHTLIVDNAGGHLMQTGQVDVVIVGADRVTFSGDVCNKIGTYLKALAAKDSRIPFYVSIPSSTIDWSLFDGLSEIPIEIRSSREVTHVQGLVERASGDLELVEAMISPVGTQGFNPAFDVTPGRLVTGLITDRGITSSNEQGLRRLFPER